MAVGRVKIRILTIYNRLNLFENRKYDEMWSIWQFAGLKSQFTIG